jgi:hypothetical protein
LHALQARDRLRAGGIFNHRGTEGTERRGDVEHGKHGEVPGRQMGGAAAPPHRIGVPAARALRPIGIRLILGNAGDDLD